MAQDGKRWYELKDAFITKIENDEYKKTNKKKKENKYTNFSEEYNYHNTKDCGELDTP